MPEYPWERRHGAVPIDAARTRFRVWSPDTEPQVELRGERHPMEDAGFGMYEAVLEAREGDDYRFVVGDGAHPDPSSRWQPEGLRGPSRVLDTKAFKWTDGGFDPPALEDLVLYELHVGTFSPEGTFEGAIPFLEELRDLGVNAIELLPVAEYPGNHGWGYDGVFLSAAQSSYGGPHGLQKLVDAAHRAGLAVVLDVVYNHLGASGVQAVEAFGPYFTDKHETFWGKALNYDDERCDPVREWVLQSAEGWIRDFHLDGLRLDAIHAIADESAYHLVRAISDRVHRTDSRAVVIAESGMNDPKVMRPASRGGWGCDAAWADDFHHALRVLLTGEDDGYYSDFGEVRQLAKAFRRPHVHDGEYSPFRKRRFGAKADDVPPEAFVVFCQNHDQVGNRAFGDRLPVETRPLAAFLTLLSPFTPMLFQGEEHGDEAPFQFFSDHIDEEIATATREGRRREFAYMASFTEQDVPDPQDPATFERSKLHRTGEPEGLRDLYKRLIAVRRQLPRAEIEALDFDEDARWLRFRRGPYTLVVNLHRERPVRVDADGEVVVATHPGVRPPDLPPLSGVLLR